MGTSGAGRGLDDSRLFPVFDELSRAGHVVFVHPHYGVGNEHFHDTGHALFLALGFPFETTIAAARMIATGALDRFPDLKLFLAHAGGALPSLIGRLDSCVVHDIALANKLRKAPSEYLKDMYFDAIAYTPQNLQALISLVGLDRLMFGTDNPFFPPPGHKGTDPVVWPSTAKVFQTIDQLPLSEADKERIVRGNAAKILGL